MDSSGSDGIRISETVSTSKLVPISLETVGGRCKYLLKDARLKGNQRAFIIRISNITSLDKLRVKDVLMLDLLWKRYKNYGQSSSIC